MALNFPYIYISCPCSDASRRALTSKRVSREISVDEALDQDDSTFNPKQPRSAFSLFPPEHLFYCEDCQDLKCPRCVVEEIVCTYCPQCLFDAIPSSVKSDGNRCARNCYTCPICFSQLNTSSLPSSRGLERPYILNCQYCMWTSLESGIDFANPSGIRSQMNRRDGVEENAKSATNTAKFGGAYDDVNRKRGTSGLSREYKDSTNGIDTEEGLSAPAPEKELNHSARYNALKSFYKEQLLASETSQSSALDAAFSSPSSLTRLMNLYSSGGNVLRKQKQKTSVMREALTSLEGLQLSADGTGQNMQQYDDTPTPEQRALQYPAPIGNPSAMSVSQLKPMPTLLKTKRSKRCAACKHILVKPELKVTSTRYRIKLIALSYIPFITVKPVPGTSDLVPAGPDGDPKVRLQPGRPSQWILTMKNPLFEEVNVSLGSPSITPGKLGHKVTILCPQFGIGKNGDVWDDAALSSNIQKSDTQVSLGFGGEQVAGKVYDRGRNWTSIVIEIVPASIVTSKDEVIGEDEDVIEIPVRVRLEWKITDEQALRDSTSNKKEVDGEGDDGSRELSYWTVLGIGRVG